MRRAPLARSIKEGRGIQLLRFGGFRGTSRAAQVPANSQLLWQADTACWLDGPWRAHEVRRTLAGRRRIAVIGPCGIPDGELARLATHGVPDDVAWRWPGSYTVVAADDHETTIWTDVGGAWPIYTTWADGGMHWSSSARALASLKGSRVDVDRLAAWLIAPGVPTLWGVRSAFADVSLLPPGYRVTLTANGSVDRQPVWRPQPRAGDHLARLRAELSSAVAVRVDAAASPTADLSGGLDSTSLVVLAAERLAPERSITGVTLHPRGNTTDGDARYAREAGGTPGVYHRWLSLGSEHMPYSLLDVPATDEPAPSTIGYASFSARLGWLRDQAKTDSHMTGDGGDGLLCTPALFLADLIRARRYGRATVETMRWARLNRRSVSPLLRSARRVARTTPASALDAWANALSAIGQSAPTVKLGHGDVAWFPPVSPPPWATDSLWERVAMAAAAVPGSDDTREWPDWTTRRLAEVMADTGRTARADVDIAAHAGVPLHNPFLDSRLLDACLSMPTDERPGPSDYKPVLRRALADLLPESIAGRVSKGDQTADYYQGLRANRAAIEDMAHGRLAALGLVDPTMVRQLVTRAATGMPDAYGMVEPFVSAEVWLCAVESAPVTPWKMVRAEQGVS
ncbi:albusnodin/ikarugamycin family macrolactam cyclase [Actinokineospora enzanensis]|uniref:albusnodin/ikarugamycin family macrolactam cyclase n=1 Tax=Actinokineospora enzanensis TaxID=155975 RepID=UPI00039B4794|nr:albusnodin/ikarugamycin family macrolactam cyclase [Actinokineospora enzanensis]